MVVTCTLSPGWAVVEDGDRASFAPGQAAAAPGTTDTTAPATRTGRSGQSRPDADTANSGSMYTVIIS